MPIARLRNPRQAFAGLIFAAIGALACVQAQSLELGTLTQMGPGYFPTCLGGALVLTGTLLVLLGFAGAPVEGMPNFAWLDAGFVLGGVLVFAWLIDHAGLVEAVVALVVLGCYGRVVRRPVELVSIAIILAAATVGLFVYGLGIPVAAW